MALQDEFHANNSNAQYNPPSTVTRTSHSVTIIGPDGKPVGLINGWNVSMTRQVTEIYELNADTSGLPYENVPGNLGGLTIQVNRFDLWNKRMEASFGSTDLTHLAMQQKPFAIVEQWIKPDNTIEKYSYTGCWFTSIGRNLSSTDARTVNVNAQLKYVFKRRVQ